MITTFDVDFAEPAASVYVGTGGNLLIDTADGTTLYFANHPSGAVLPVSCKRVRTTGGLGTTSASNLVGLR